MASPVDGSGSATSGSLDATIEKAIASLEEMMAKQIQFTIDSNPLKAGDSVAKGSRLG
jgi:hypothetical protein